MSKTLRTLGDYIVKAGDGFNAGSGTNTIKLDSRHVRITGDLTVDGDQTVINTSTVTVEDPILILARNNSVADVDAGIMVNRGDIGNNAALYWNEGDDVFKAVTTVSNGTGTSITDTALANIRVGEPSDNSDAATKNYVDSSLSSLTYISSFDITDGVTTETIVDQDTITFTGLGNIIVEVAPTDTVYIDLEQNLTNINSVSNGVTNGNLELIANGTGSVVVNNILTFNSTASTPSAGSITKLYAKTPQDGGTGVFFINSSIDSGTEGELISKKKARALAIALG